MFHLHKFYCYFSRFTGLLFCKCLIFFWYHIMYFSFQTFSFSTLKVLCGLFNAFHSFPNYVYIFLYIFDSIYKIIMSNHSIILTISGLFLLIAIIFIFSHYSSLPASSHINNVLLDSRYWNFTLLAAGICCIPLMSIKIWVHGSITCRCIWSLWGFLLFLF